MPNVTVYRFEKYDIASDQIVRSTRRATRATIMSINAQVVPGSEVEIDEELLTNGMTERHFSPLHAKAAEPLASVPVDDGHGVTAD